MPPGLDPAEVTRPSERFYDFYLDGKKAAWSVEDSGDDGGEKKGKKRGR